jgi:hypothetical protein
VTAVERVYWETEPSSYVEVPSCKVGEFPTIYDYAVRLLETSVSGGEEGICSLAREILEYCGIQRKIEEVTEADLWNILLAKAGPAKRKILERLPDMASEMVVDFFGRAVREGELEIPTTPTEKESSGNGKNM